MAKKSADDFKLTLPQVKKKLESMGEENLDQFQRRTLDYASKFSKIEFDEAQKLVPKLIAEFGLDEDEAIQIINCMPKSVDELRVFLVSGRKIVETGRLEAIVALLEEGRKLK